MLIRHSNRVLLSSGVAGIALTSLILAGTAAPPQSSMVFAPDPVSLSLVAMQADQKKPDWLAVPGRSTRPVVMNDPMRAGSGRISYFTLAEPERVVSFHQSRLAGLGIEFVALRPQNEALKITGVHVGRSPDTGMEVTFSIRDFGHVRGVEVTYRKAAPEQIAAIQPVHQ